MKTNRSKKNNTKHSKRGGGGNQSNGSCVNLSWRGNTLGPGIMVHENYDANCQRGGNKRRKTRSKKRRVDNKKVELIINQLCKSMKKKCTPKFKTILKKIVIKNM
jgi:hypothetical protein